MLNNSVYNPSWQESRINFIISIYGEDFFKQKRILELGAFHGDIGNYFNLLGSDVTCVEGKYENYIVMSEKYPDIKSINFNLDCSNWDFGNFDIIINFGLFYHLQNRHVDHLKNCVNNCELLFFESVIFDSEENELFFRSERGIDQSLSEVGGTPTSRFVEEIFLQNDVSYQRYDDNKLDSGPHLYSWESKNTKVYDGYKRRFWIIENKKN